MRLRFVFPSLFLAAFAICAIGCGSGGGEQTEHAAWSYEGETGPEHWEQVDDEYELCEDGVNQSPVNLTGAVRAGFPKVTTDYRPEQLEIEDTGHAIEARVVDPVSSISIAGTRYRLEQFHFHMPSEETIEGRRFPASLHMVHISEQGKIAVVGMMVEPGKTNPALAFDIPDSSDSATEAEEEIDPNLLIPENETAYRYEGSLTTPPCTEGVIWTVFRQPITMSAARLEAIRQVHHGNVRPIQPINARSVKLGPALAD